MDHAAGQIGARALYPACQPFARLQLAVGDGHVLYVEESGNPMGQPVVVVHGGPGGGCSPFMRRFFDPAHYRVVMFDQRGCGLSTPNASIDANTTAHLVADMQAIRQQLGIDQWLLFGGSWGATLALSYAQAHPETVSGLVLRGVFLGMQAELDWFYRGGAAMFWPDQWAEFCAPIPPEERGDMIAAYHRRLFSGDHAQERRFAQHWVKWENGLAGMDVAQSGNVPGAYARAFARLECHYFLNECFLQPGQLLRDRHLIEHLPCQIVQGRYDMICPPRSAWQLAQGWENCALHMIPASGHALSESRIADRLAAIMDDLK